MVSRLPGAAVRARAARLVRRRDGHDPGTGHARNPRHAEAGPRLRFPPGVWAGFLAYASEGSTSRRHTGRVRLGSGRAAPVEPSHAADQNLMPPIMLATFVVSSLIVGAMVEEAR